MKATDRARILLRVQADISRQLVDIRRLSSVLEDNRAGYRSGHAGGPAVMDLGTSEEARTDCEWDQTSAAAMVSDPGRAAEKELDRLLGVLDKTMESIDNIRLKWMAEPQREDREPGAWCEECAKENGQEPIRYSQTRVGARLEEPLDLCWWHYRRVLVAGVLPTRGETRKHLRGDRVPVVVADSTPTPLQFHSDQVAVSVQVAEVG